MEPYFYNCEVIRVIDGDTLVADIDVGFNIWLRNQRIRFYGVNTPEIKGEEREDGLISKDFVSRMIADRKVMLHVIDKSDKYGRVLADVYVKGDAKQFVNLNKLLVFKGLAKEYLL